MNTSLLILLSGFWITAANAQGDDSWASTAKTTFTPEIHYPNIASITLFAQNPDIVTPVGVAVGPDGRVFVQENQTHKRNSGYEGPEFGRIHRQRRRTPVVESRQAPVVRDPEV